MALPAQSARLWARERREMLSLAAPLILSNLTMIAISSTDVMLMGRLSKDALAASALGVNVSMIFNTFCWGMIQAASPMMAAELGRRAHSVRDIRRTFRQTLWILTLMMIPMWGILWFAEPIMIALGQDPVLAKGAGEFLHGYMWCQFPFLVFQVIRNFMAALSRPGWALAVSLIAIPVNLLISWSLIFGKFGLPALGLFGGGLGSTITWTITMLAMAVVVLKDRQFRRFHLFGRFWRPDWPRFRQLLKLGVPIAITYGFEGTVFSIGVYFMGLIDRDAGEKVAVAAHAIALQIAAISFMVPMGIAQATTVRVGYGYGRKDAAAIHRAGWTGFALGVGFMGIMALVIFAIPELLASAFIDAADTENGKVMALAISFLGYAAIFQLFDGAQVVGSGMLRGLQDTRWPMIYAGLGYWVVGLLGGVWLAFPMDWDGAGIWMGFVAGLAVVSVLMLRRWLMRERLGLLPG